MFNIGIVGSRSYPHLDIIAAIVVRFVEEQDFKLISGGAEGPDKVAEITIKKCCQFNSKFFEIYYPNWNKFGKNAGHIRNSEIVVASGLIVCFYNSLSRTHGALDTLSKQIKLEKPAICVDENKEIAHWNLDKLKGRNLLNGETVLKIIEENILLSNSKL